MRVSFRPAALDELSPCFEQLGCAAAYTSEIAPRVPGLWEQYFRQGSLMTTRFEDLDQNTVIGLSLEVFVTDAFVQEIRQRPRPFLREELIRRELAGRSAVLTLAQAQAANENAGLNLFFLNDPLPPHECPPVLFHAIDARWGEALYNYRSCNLKTITWECYSQQALQMGLSCGMKLFPYPDGTTQRHPVHLTTITREEALAQYGTHVSQMFIYAPARFSFTLGQQELLRRALMGETDEELAGALYLSLSAVKKRWFSIYDRVYATDPRLLPTEDDVRQARGAEKRRHLLRYVRSHPEELHPINAELSR